MPEVPEALYARRLAARGLALVLEQLGVEGVAVKINPDDPAQCLTTGNAGEVALGDDLLRRWEPFAWVVLDGARARIVVERIDRLVRPNHLRDFVPEEIGIVPMRGRPDVDVEVNLEDVIEEHGELLRTAPQRPVPPRPRSARTFTVKRALGSRSRR